MNCFDCSAPITRQSRTGRCRRCAAIRSGSDPQAIARRSETLRRRIEAEPTFRRKLIQKLHESHMRARRDPEKQKKMLATIYRNREGLQRPGVKEKWLAGRAEAGRKRHETVMAWCPREYRDRYVFLRLSRRMLAADAKRQVLAEIEAATAKLTPFERQLQAIRNGAGIVEVKPIPRRTYDGMTLGGVASGMLA